MEVDRLQPSLALQFGGHAAAAVAAANGVRRVSTKVALGDLQRLQLQSEAASRACSAVGGSREDAWSTAWRASPDKSEASRPSPRQVELLKNDDMFQELDPAVWAKMPSMMTQAYERRGQVLFREGDPPGRCYVVVTGEVGIWRKLSPEEELQAEKEETKETLKQAKRNEFGTHLVTLGPGAMFGELAVLQGVPRAATATCEEDCELLFLEQADFERLLKKELSRLREDRLSFLHLHLPGMKSLAYNIAETVLRCFRKAVFQKGQVILEQGKDCNKAVFLIFSESAELWRSDATWTHSAQGGRVGSMVRGGLFGSVDGTGTEPFTVRAGPFGFTAMVTKGKDLKRMPHQVKQLIQEALTRAFQWRVGHGQFEAAKEITDIQAATTRKAKTTWSKTCNPFSKDLPVLRRVARLPPSEDISATSPKLQPSPHKEGSGRSWALKASTGFQDRAKPKPCWGANEAAEERCLASCGNKVPRALRLGRSSSLPNGGRGIGGAVPLD